MLRAAPRYRYLITWTPLFPGVSLASLARYVLACWRLGGGPGALPVQFLGSALSFHHHDTIDQLPLCLQPAATKPCRIPRFDSRHSLWARSWLHFFVAFHSPSCRSREDPVAVVNRTARVKKGARCLVRARSQRLRPITIVTAEFLARVPNEWGPRSVFDLGTPTCHLCKAEVLNSAFGLRSRCVAASTAGCHFAFPRPASAGLPEAHFIATACYAFC